MTEPFRVFSGWDSRQAEAAEVFAFSVRANASIDVAVHFISAEDTPTTVAACKRRGVTAFSYARFAVPYASGYQGRALWCDGCDQLCLGDVKELAEFDMQGKPVAVVKHPPPRMVPRPDLRARSWTSLMLFDCEQMQVWNPAMVEHASDDTLMRLRGFSDEQIGSLPVEWNALVEPRPQQIPVQIGAGPVVHRDGLLEAEPTQGTKLAHWSYLSDPNGNSWIDRSGSALWFEWRERWRQSQSEAAK